MSSALFGRGTFLQMGNRSRQDQLDKQLTELRSFAVAATQEIRDLKEKVARLEQAVHTSEQKPEPLNSTVPPSE